MIYNSNFNLKEYSKVLRLPQIKEKMMITMFVIVALIEITTAATIEPISDLVTGKIITQQKASFSCPANTLGNVCADDCKTLLTCIRRTTTPAGIRTCSDVLPSRPFCVPGERSCSAIADSTITSCSLSKFVCTNTGYFPDPRNCNQYHVCTDDSSQTYECPPRYVYDVANFKCKRRRFANDCSRVNCVRSQNKYVVYPTMKSYYAYCGLAGDIIMFRCAESNNFEFNPTTVNCEFVCKAEGTYPDYQNDQQFYECYKSRGRLVSRIQKCPTTNMFDPIAKVCVKNTATTPITTTRETPTTDTTTTEPTIIDSTTTDTITIDITTTDTTTTDRTTTNTTITDTTTTETTTTDATATNITTTFATTSDITTTTTTSTDPSTTDTSSTVTTTIDPNTTTTDITTTKATTTTTDRTATDTTDISTILEDMEKYGDTLIKHEPIYFKPTYISHKGVETNSSKGPPNKSTLIEWLLDSK